MIPDLKILADLRKDLLLAEVGGWLHDMGKCSDEFLNNKNRRIKCKGHDIDPYKAILCLEDLENYNFSPKFKPVRYCETDHQYALNKILGKINCKKINLQFKFSGNEYSIGEVIYFGRPIFIGKTNDLLKKNLEPIEYLARSHGAAHIEKEGNEGLIDQKADDFRLSSPFGFETALLEGFTDKLKNLPFDKINVNRLEFLDALKKAFENAPGDTQRPINEVDLWDWSSIVAALYKSALAGTLLGVKPQPNDLKWRLLAIRVNSEQIWGNASNIPALITRKDWLSEGLDNVKELLEKTYPLGNEVYRDENGSIFVVPDIDKLLEIRESEENKTLNELISESLGYEGEIIVTPGISSSWWGQNPDGHPDPRRDQVPPIADILLESPYSPADASMVKKWWDDADGNPEICTISWLRPQEHEGSLRKASKYWAEKVTGRAENWRKNLDSTIWIDEVADSNGRICLIAGKLDITEWLKPGGHIQTLLVKPASSNPNNVIKKTPSFARLRRVWETTKKFWDDVEFDFKETVGAINQRIKIVGEFKSGNRNTFSARNAYEAELDGKRFTIFYEGNNEFLIIENLQNLARKMDATVKQLRTYDTSAAYVKEYLTGKNLKIYDSEGKRETPINQLNVFHIEIVTTPYIPAIPILSEPSMFMAIIPADKALKVAEVIKEKYEKEIGKVRNRLPISLGLVFSKSHTPLAAMMDAGRRMMKVSDNEEEWILEDDAQDCGSECILKSDKGVSIRVPIKMGDSLTDDIWYPYYYVSGFPHNRSTAFEGPKGWLVHVKELKKDDILKISPSHLDFELLDSAARRFEINYKDGKRRDKRKCSRPYYLEELIDFIRLWSILKNGLARTQIKGMIGLIETKREEWQVEPNNVTFKIFVHDVIHNANWKNGKNTEIEEIEKAAVSGKLNDIVELYMDILKDKEDDI